MISPDMVIDLAITTLRARHREHLAALERQHGLTARTLEPFQDEAVTYLAGSGFRLREDFPPAVQLGIFGFYDPPELDKDGWKFSWALSAEVTAEGSGREDTLRRTYWYGMAVVQCLMRDLPRAGNPIDFVRIADMDFANGDADTQRTIAQAQLLFHVEVRQSLDLTVPPGGPLTDPYDPPAQWPLVQSAHTTVEKEPLP